MSGLTRATRLAGLALVLFLTLACGGSIDEEFKLTPVDEIPGFDMPAQYVGQLCPPGMAIQTPAPLGAVVRVGGLAGFPGMPVCAIWSDTENGIARRKWHMVIDTNGNRNLMDDPVLKPRFWSKWGETKLPDFWGRNVPYDISVTCRGDDRLQAHVFAHRKAFYRGYLDMGGEKRMAVLLDADRNGLAQGLRARNHLCIDADGDGEVRSEGVIGDSEGHVMLPSETVSLMGRVWSCTIDDTKPSVELKPYDGPVGRFSLRADWGDKPRARLFGIRITLQNDGVWPDWIPCDSSVPAIALPAGRHLLHYAQMEIVAPRGRKSACVTLQPLNPYVEIEKGKEIGIALREIPGVEPTVSTPNPDSILVGYTYSAIDGFVVTRVAPFGFNRPQRSIGQVRVYRGTKPEGEPFEVASMEYG